MEGVSVDRLRRIPTPGEWSAHVVVCHLVLDEMNTTAVLRLILTEDCPILPNIDGDNRLCATRFAPLYADTATALGVWRALREDNVRLCASVSLDDLERVGRAPWRNGERITFREYVATRSRHDRAHIEQIKVGTFRLTYRGRSSIDTRHVPCRNPIETPRPPTISSPGPADDALRAGEG